MLQSHNLSSLSSEPSINVLWDHPKTSDCSMASQTPIKSEGTISDTFNIDVWREHNWNIEDYVDWTMTNSILIIVNPTWDFFFSQFVRTFFTESNCLLAPLCLHQFPAGTQLTSAQGDRNTLAQWQAWRDAYACAHSRQNRAHAGTATIMHTTSACPATKKPMQQKWWKTRILSNFAIFARTRPWTVFWEAVNFRWSATGLRNQIFLQIWGKWKGSGIQYKFLPLWGLRALGTKHHMG